MNQVTDLSHHQIKLKSGAFVLALNTGAVISSEAQAMLCALFSRSPGSVVEHLKIIAEKGAAHFMEQNYVGYGHKSIGDCGDACVFIEGVSMLAAKAIQHFLLYNGQEVSTRYVDFSKQRFLNPVGSSLGERILENWRTFYMFALPEFVPVLMNRYPRKDGESKAIYTKAINARAFDTMRAFLPAGASTNLAWVGELRQFADRLPVLRHHPLQEVREVGRALEVVLRKTHTSSFSKKRYRSQEAYLERMSEYTYDSPIGYVGENVVMIRDNIDRGLLGAFKKLRVFSGRPAKTELPDFVRECGQAGYGFQLDFGSFRDLQRQRSLIMPMPLLTTIYGFEEWYLNELPPRLAAMARKLLEDQLRLLAELDPPQTLMQYYLPMGYKVPIKMYGDLRSLVYVAELRATRFVHPTLRIKMVDYADQLRERFGIKLHLDPEPDRFDIKRGTHDITKVA